MHAFEVAYYSHNQYTHAVLRRYRSQFRGVLWVQL